VITGEQVTARRKLRGLSRRALADSTGLTEGKIWRIENRGIISQDEAEALAAVLPADSAEGAAGGGW
jgi:transcriptional regulator with XRE-family HTH domain